MDKNKTIEFYFNGRFPERLTLSVLFTNRNPCQAERAGLIRGTRSAFTAFTVGIDSSRDRATSTITTEMAIFLTKNAFFLTENPIILTEIAKSLTEVAISLTEPTFTNRNPCQAERAGLIRGTRSVFTAFTVR